MIYATISRHHNYSTFSFLLREKIDKFEELDNEKSI